MSLNLTLERVIHPGWLTRTYENGSKFHVTHTCVVCGLVVVGSYASNRDELAEHERRHPENINAELYRFRGAVHSLHPVYGFQTFTWPDRFPREFFDHPKFGPRFWREWKP
jgi:hypothetical protein